MVEGIPGRGGAQETLSFPEHPRWPCSTAPGVPNSKGQRAREGAGPASAELPLAHAPWLHLDPSSNRPTFEAFLS